MWNANEIVGTTRFGRFSYQSRYYVRETKPEIERARTPAKLHANARHSKQRCGITVPFYRIRYRVRYTVYSRRSIELFVIRRRTK